MSGDPGGWLSLQQRHLAYPTGPTLIDQLGRLSKWANHGHE